MASTSHNVIGRKVVANSDLVYTGMFKDGVLNDKGEVRSLSSKSLIEKGQFRNGCLVNGAIFNPQTNTIISNGTYKNGKLHGYDTLYYTNGNVYCEGVFLNEELHGIAVFYWESGKIKFNGKIINNQPCGLCKFYDPNGVLTTEVEYDNGVELAITTYSRNHCMCKACMQNGKREGPGQEWDFAGHLIFAGNFHENRWYSGTLYRYSIPNAELIGYKLTLKDGIPSPTVEIFATPNLEATAIDDSWRLVYSGGWQSGTADLSIIERAGNGRLYLPDGRILEGQWSNDCISPESIVTVEAPKASERFPLRKGGWYVGNVLLDDRASLLQPILLYHGKGRFYFTDKSFFDGIWDNGVLKSYWDIFWPNGKVKYHGGIKQYALNDPKMIHEYLPTGLVRYYPLNQNLIIEGQFEENYNCINNPITVYMPDGRQIQRNADYSMESDNYNVHYVNF